MTLIFFYYVGLDLNDLPHYLKRNKNLGLCLRLGHGVKFVYSFMETPVIENGAEITRIGGFVKITKIERNVQANR
jgi:hypothetical protein